MPLRYANTFSISLSSALSPVLARIMLKPVKTHCRGLIHQILPDKHFEDLGLIDVQKYEVGLWFCESKENRINYPVF